MDHCKCVQCATGQDLATRPTLHQSRPSKAQNARRRNTQFDKKKRNLLNKLLLNNMRFYEPITFIYCARLPPGTVVSCTVLDRVVSQHRHQPIHQIIGVSSNRGVPHDPARRRLRVQLGESGDASDSALHVTGVFRYCKRPQWGFSA